MARRPASDRVRQCLLLLLLAGSAGPGAAHSAVDEPPAPGTYIWVGSHRLHLNCQGAGSPTVVFDAGLGGSSLDWTLVQPEVASFTRACTYDRAGYAWSDPGPLPRDVGNIVRDLEQLLGNGSVAAPYVLVGHSLGGLIAQHFARRNPQRIAGVVLIDATHDEQFRRLEKLVVPPGQARRTARLAMHNSYSVPEGLPEEVRRIVAAFVARAQSIVVVQSELNFLLATARAAPTARAEFPDVPLVVISHRETPPGAPVLERRLAEAWMEMQLDLAALTRRSSHVIAGTDDHYVHVREPETVIDAVRNVVEQHRREGGPDAGAPTVPR